MFIFFSGSIYNANFVHNISKNRELDDLRVFEILMESLQCDHIPIEKFDTKEERDMRFEELVKMLTK